MNRDSNSSQFLSTDGGKTKPNAIEIPSIALPKGGGALKGIDEKFSVNAVNGTAAFSIPLPFSPARGAVPQLNLSYNSGSGNGIFGLGWSLDLPSIKRKTDKGLPQYLDAADSDTFLFSEAEDLVPEFKKDANGNFMPDGDGAYIISETEATGGAFTIRYYRPRIEGLFARIERWTSKTSGEKKWKVTTKDNVTTLFGWTQNARISDPNDESKIYEWLPEFVFDDKGNCSQYVYKKEDSTGFDERLLHNRNRLKNGSITYTNLYIKQLLYGNKTPYGKFEDAFPAETDYMFQTVFDYGALLNGDSPETVNDWDFRQDAFSNYKAGFEIRTTRLCRRVLLFHVFDELALKQDRSDRKTLIRSVDMGYETSAEQDFVFLRTITSCGYIKKTGGAYAHKNFPPMEFAYQQHDWNKEVKTIAAGALIHAPAGLDEQHYQFTDLYNEGLPGILTEQANGWYYKHNSGDGVFEQAKLVTPKPSFAGLGGALHLADLDSDGGRQLVSFGTAPRGYFELNDNNEWQRFHTFKTMPNIDFADAHTRMLDLNGDGKPEVVISEDNVFTWYASEGRDGFAAARKTIKPFDEEAGPHIVFADAQQTIYLADMSGDGMTDILRIRNGEVCYWPNLGYGNFGTKVALDNAPIFDHPGAFNPSYLRLADIDGSGTSDIIYLGNNKFTCWKNLNGNSFSTTPFEIDIFPEIHSQAKVTVTDLLGNGVACIAWSSPLPKNVHAPLKYIDLMNGKKPHIMVSYKNNLGKEVSFEYTASTKFYIQDKLAGKPWVTKLHFPVHCVSKTITEDKISGCKFVSEYQYHHGCYDHAEREFRGFGMVEQTDAETFEHWQLQTAANITEAALHQEPVVTKTWHHTGAFLQEDKILSQFEADYWYAEWLRSYPGFKHHENALPDARLMTAPGIAPSAADHLSAQEWQEALRACKGMTLRSEIFAKDAVKYGNSAAALQKEKVPFSVATHNCLVELIQPKGQNKHAVFVVKESEAITYNYERNFDDPRITHNLNIRLDEYGNVLESATVVYPRLQKNIGDTLPEETKDAQKKTVILYTQNQFTNDIIAPDAYRLRLPADTKTFEINVAVTEDYNAFNYYTPACFDNILSDAKTDLVQYHEAGVPLKDGKPQRRLTEHIRSLYYKNDLTGPLPAGRLASLALPFESYQLAYTPGLLHDIYSDKADAPTLASLMTEGKFAHAIDENGNADANWWVRSGTTQLIQGAETVAHAQSRFYVPVSYTDPYGAVTRVKYYGTYFLFIEETEDALGNKAGVVNFNFRTLSPQRMKDSNDNLSEAVSDELGLVKAIAVMGKGNQADDLTGHEETAEQEQAAIDAFFTIANAPGVCDAAGLQNIAKQLLLQATTRFLYDFDTYINTGKPAAAATITRETHYRKKDGSLNPESNVQLSFEYSNGLGEVIMKKVQAEPGVAKQIQVLANNSITINEINTGSGNSRQLRWIGNGRTIKNNKGNAVKQYEPFFSVTPKFEAEKELVETGVTPVMYYDATGRLVKTVMPDGSFSKLVFDSWKQLMFDANDTVLESEWYLKRTDTTRPDFIAGIKEQQAAAKAGQHAGTPDVLHLDTLGRPVLSVAHNKNTGTSADEFYETKLRRDTEGNLRMVTDARKLPENKYQGNTVVQYKYDMLGNLVYKDSMDAGRRWLLLNILGNPLRTWDKRNHEFQYTYDILHRPVESKVTGGDGTERLSHIFDRIFYGETETNPEQKNLRGKPVKHYDTGGVVLTPEYDFKGKPVAITRKLFKKYKEVADWTDANLLNDLENDAFTFTTDTDALGRITRQTAPDGSIIIPSYNEAGLLDSESMLHAGAALPSVYIKSISYNEKGLREKIMYGNDVTTTFTYDKETFRLAQLVSRRKNNDLLQHLQYTYDPVGNITCIEDKAQPILFSGNQLIEPKNEYTYDALYRLIAATGKEKSAAVNFGTCDNWNDKPFMHALNPADPMTVRHYTQNYQYDAVGNITAMRHQAGGGNWTRSYVYETNNNRLKSTQIGDIGYTSYKHHQQHGFLQELPHLEKINWNFKEEVVLTARQRCINDTIPVITYYQYDGSGQRIRKITENQAAPGATATKKEERVYVAGYELYKKHSGAAAGLERVSLSLIDDGHRFVMTETRNDVPDGTEQQLVRYQLHNHLGSAALELDDMAAIISYEEYHPFGTTAYQLSSKRIESAAKRYRYTGMERDDETGLEYHSARYYLPWLGRWLNADPIGIGDGVNVYGYCGNNPIGKSDTDGKQSNPKTASNTLIILSQGFEKFEFGKVGKYSSAGRGVWTSGTMLQGGKAALVSLVEHPMPSAGLQFIYPGYNFRASPTLAWTAAAASLKTPGDNILTKQLKSGIITAEQYARRSATHALSIAFEAYSQGRTPTTPYDMVKALSEQGDYAKATTPKVATTGSEVLKKGGKLMHKGTSALTKLAPLARTASNFAKLLTLGAIAISAYGISTAEASQHTNPANKDAEVFKKRADSIFDLAMLPLSFGPAITGSATKYVTGKYIAPALDKHTDYFDHAVALGKQTEAFSGSIGIENKTAKKVIGGAVTALASTPQINLWSRIFN